MGWGEGVESEASAQVTANLPPRGSHWRTFFSPRPLPRSVSRLHSNPSGFENLAEPRTELSWRRWQKGCVYGRGVPPGPQSPSRLLASIIFCSCCGSSRRSRRSQLRSCCSGRFCPPAARARRTAAARVCSQASRLIEAVLLASRAGVESLLPLARLRLSPFEASRPAPLTLAPAPLAGA